MCVSVSDSEEPASAVEAVAEAVEAEASEDDADVEAARLQAVDTFDNFLKFTVGEATSFHFASPFPMSLGGKAKSASLSLSPTLSLHTQLLNLATTAGGDGERGREVC